MNDILISVLIPTRSRPEKLRRCIESILHTASNPDRIEFVLRIDDDDPAIYDGINMQVLKGPRVGHARHAEMYWELAQAASGKRVWFFNDDAGIVNKPGWISAALNPDMPAWDDRLSEIPSGKLVLSPESNIWGKKRVTWNDLPQNRHHTCHFPILPNRFWEQCGMTRFEEPLDTFLLNRLTGKGFGGQGCGLGWELKILSNLTTFHYQESDELFKQQGRTTFFGTEKDGKLLGYEVLTPAPVGGKGNA